MDFREHFVLGDATLVTVKSDKNGIAVKFQPGSTYYLKHCHPKTLAAELRLCADYGDAVNWVTGLLGGFWLDAAAK